MNAHPTSSVMLDDSLAARHFQGHDYKGSLLGDSLSKEWDVVETSADNGTLSFFDRLHDFLSSLPWVVYAIVGVLLLALLAYWLFRSGMLSIGHTRTVAESEADNIYEIDYDHELEEARRASDYSRLVRLVYLRTLRTLDEEGRITWRIYKTPTEYAAELNQPVFRQMTDIFLRVRYGGFSADSHLYDQMCSWQAMVQKGGAS